MEDVFICTNNQSVVVLVWEYAKPSEIDSLLVKVVILKTRLGLFLVLQVIEENVTVGAATRETSVIFEPVYTAHLAHVTLALHVGGALASVEIVHRNRISVSCGKEMTAIAEPNFTTALDWQWRDVLLLFQTA